MLVVHEFESWVVIYLQLNLCGNRITPPQHKKQPHLQQNHFGGWGEVKTNASFSTYYELVYLFVNLANNSMD